MSKVVVVLEITAKCNHLFLEDMCPDIGWESVAHFVSRLSSGTSLRNGHIFYEFVVSWLILIILENDRSYMVGNRWNPASLCFARVEPFGLKCLNNLNMCKIMSNLNKKC